MPVARREFFKNLLFFMYRALSLNNND